jgi:hypothetical protein
MVRADLFTRSKGARDTATSLIRFSRRVRRRSKVLFARSERARKQSASVATAPREVILTFGLIRFTPVSGGSGDVGDVRDALQTLLSFGTLAVCVGPSLGARCDACDRSIAIGGAQYEATTDERGMHLDGECFEVLMDEIARTRWRRP